MQFQIFSRHRIRSLFPNQHEIDNTWPTLRYFLKRHYPKQIISNDLLFNAVDYSVQQLALPITPLVLMQNSRNNTCINPLIIPLTKLYLDSYFHTKQSKKNK